MFSLIKTLFGTPKIVDSIMNSGDKLFYTKEEEADDNKALGRLDIEYVKALNLGSIASQITRRMFGFMVIFAWLSSFFLAIGLYLTGQKECAEAIRDFVKDWNVGWGAVTIIGFYFVRQMVVKK